MENRTTISKRRDRCRSPLLLAAIVFIVQSPFQRSIAQVACKNLSVNPTDLIDSLWNLQATKTYPHAQSNSECRGEAWFRARCAINDTIKNTSHGQGYPSWGPDTVPVVWWKVSFGKNVLVDSITIYIRADFPHDDYFYKGRFNFSDGSTLPFTLDSTARPQSFKFAAHTTSYVLIDSLIWHKVDSWCAFTQVQVFGYDQASEVHSAASTGRTLPQLVRTLAGPGMPIRIPKGVTATAVYSISGRKIMEYMNRMPDAASLLRLPATLSQRVIVIGNEK